MNQSEERSADQPQEQPEQLPTFASNLDGQTVAEAINRLFRISREDLNSPHVAIATAYINPGGFSLLADELERIPRVRLLIGAEPDPAPQPAAAKKGIADEQLDNHESWLRKERDLTGFEPSTTESTKRLVRWLRSQADDGAHKVEVRRYCKGFLHGKAFISEHPRFPAVLAGSSNFTYAGLARNAELNIGYPGNSGGYAKDVQRWFEYYWQQSESYDLAALYEQQWVEHSPWIIFLRMLWELYGADLADEQGLASSLQLARFQSDGVARALRLIKECGGALVADEVGLGKTFLAGDIIHRFAKESKGKVLVVSPAALKGSVWEGFLVDYNLPRRVQVLTYDEIRIKYQQAQKQGQLPDFRQWAEEYALVVVDEAHNLRNDKAGRSQAITQVILAGEEPAKVLLLTATPVNNTLIDLETLIRYFIRDDAALAAKAIPSIHALIKEAQDAEPESLSPGHLFNLMDQVAVRRTRKFVAKNYPNDTLPGPNGQIKVKFPEAELRWIKYDIDKDGEVLIDRMVAALGGASEAVTDATSDSKRADVDAAAVPVTTPGRLSMARYTPTRYLLKGSVQAYEITNAGLLRSALLKRLESSPEALRSTLETLIASHEAFLKALNRGWVLHSKALRDYVSSESDDLNEFIPNYEESRSARPIGDFHGAALIKAVKDDLGLLRELLALAQKTLKGSNLKALRLAEELAKISTASRRPNPRDIPAGYNDKDERGAEVDRRKVIIFSTFADTIQPLHEFISQQVQEASPSSPLAAYKNRIASVITGSTKPDERAEALSGFAPKTVGGLREKTRDKYDLLFTTDALSEGVNLQQAAQIINYDLPWNPMRIVQRHGRVDRLLSEHETVQLGLFYPAAHLEKMLRLVERLNDKVTRAEAAVGATAVLPGRPRSEEVITFDTLKQQVQEAVLTRGGDQASSAEEYRRVLSAALEGDKGLKQRLIELPYKIGSGFENPRREGNGYVFCIKIGDHSPCRFRYVAVDDNWQPLVDGSARDFVGAAASGESVEPESVDANTLTSLLAAEPPTPSTSRWMGDGVYENVYSAWQLARDSVCIEWKKLTDSKSWQPEIFKPMRKAAELVLKHGDFLGEEQDALLARLNTRPDGSVLSDVREVLGGSGDPQAQIRRLREIVDAAGLRPAPKVKPLPEITEKEIRLVAWMAVKGTKPPIRAAADKL